MPSATRMHGHDTQVARRAGGAAVCPIRAGCQRHAALGMMAIMLAVAASEWRADRHPDVLGIGSTLDAGGRTIRHDGGLLRIALPRT